MLEAATADPESTVGLLDTLHAASRHVDAELLLRLIASADPATCGVIVYALRTSADTADADTLVELLHQRPVADLVTAAAAFDHSAAALRGAGSDTGHLSPSDNPLTAGLAARPSTDLVADIVRLRSEQRNEEAAVLLAVIGQGPPLIVFAAAAALAEQRLTADAAGLLIRYAADAEALDLARLFVRLTQVWESAAVHVAPVVAVRPDVEAFISALRTLEPQTAPEDCAGMLAQRLTSRQRVELCRALTGQLALADVIGWCSRHDDAPQLQTMLRQAGMHAAAYRLAERRAETTGRYEP